MTSHHLKKKLFPTTQIYTKRGFTELADVPPWRLTSKLSKGTKVLSDEEKKELFADFEIDSSLDLSDKVSIFRGQTLKLLLRFNLIVPRQGWKKNPTSF